MEHKIEHRTVQLGGLEFVCMHRNTSEDGGATIEVYGDVDGQPMQVLRFDCFHKDPHFHYAPGDRERNLQFHLDSKMAPKALDWAFEQIRENIPEMLLIAGFKPLAAQVDRRALAFGWSKVRSALKETEPKVAA